MNLLAIHFASDIRPRWGWYGSTVRPRYLKRHTVLGRDLEARMLSDHELSVHLIEVTWAISHDHD